MTSRHLRRLVLALSVTAVILGAAAFAGLHAATRVLKGQVEQALGADSEVAEIVVGWSSIEARGVRIPAPPGWPAPDALRAARVVVRPDLLGLLSARVHVPNIRVEQAYVSVWRTRDGKLRLLPSLLDKPAGKAEETASAAPPVTIGRIELQEGVLEFYDGTVRQPAYKTRLDQLHAVVEDLQIPALAGRTQVQLDGTIKGVRRNGKLAIDGWLELAAKNSELSARLAGVDLVALQPYLIKASETGVRQGSLDLTLKSTVKKNHLHAPGTVTLTGLQLSSGQGAMGTFMGAPRNAVLAALKDRNDQIAIQFTLDGNLDDPQFSLNESFAKRIGAGVAEHLGISFEGLTRGVGGAVDGIGGVMKKIFGK